MGKLMGEHADLRPGPEFSGIIAEVLKEIAGQSPQQWEKRRLRALAPELLEELRREERARQGPFSVFRERMVA